MEGVVRKIEQIPGSSPTAVGGKPAYQDLSRYTTQQ
jgi:hypothetical protein